MGIKIKLALILACLFFLTTFIMGVVMIANQRSSLEAQLRSMAGTITDEFANDSKMPLMQKDALAMNLLVQNILRYQGITDAFILNDSLHIEGHNDISGVGLKFKDDGVLQKLKGPPPWIIEDKEGVLTFAAPIIFKKTTVGYTIVSFSDKFIKQRVLYAVKRVTVFAFLAAIAASLISIPLSTALLRPVFRLFKGTKEVALGNFDYRIEAKSKDEIGDLVKSFNQMASELKKKEMLRGALNRYVSRHVADEIMKNPERVRLGGERREVTVFFADIRGFTPLTRRLEPEETVELLNRYFTVITGIIFRFEGTVDKFIGDAVMSVFGSPIESPSHLEQAVKAAFAIKKAISAVNSTRRTQGLVHLQMGIGLDSGEVIVGNMGSQARMEFTAVGDAVNMASRLSDLARAGEIIVAEPAFRLISDNVEAVKMPNVVIKGIDHPLDLYNITGLKGPWADEADFAVRAAAEKFEVETIAF